MSETKTEVGYCAFAPDGKMLRNYWSGGGQTGINKQSLTTDIELASIDELSGAIEIYTYWYNSSHKNQIDFTIKKVVRKTVHTVTLECVQDPTTK